MGSPLIAQDSTHKFFVVTGCNGVGKSTVAEALRARLGAEVFHYPVEFVRFRERVSLDTAVQELPRLLYYLGATLHLSDLVRQQLTRSPVVCDRYLESPVSLFIVESNISEAELGNICSPLLPYLRVPDVTLLLTTNYETACSRIRERVRGRSSEAERRVLESPDFFRKREIALRTESDRLGPMVELDTTNLSIKEMCESAWALVKSS